MNDLARALATSAGILLPVVILIVIVSIVAVKRGEAEMLGAGGHGGHAPEPGAAAVAAPAAKAKATGPVVEEINVGVILAAGVGLFTLTVLALLGVSILEHMN